MIQTATALRNALKVFRVSVRSFQGNYREILLGRKSAKGYRLGRNLAMNPTLYDGQLPAIWYKMSAAPSHTSRTSAYCM